ncbi:MAG: CHAT domain-containing tetratricopeptide repeat protein [Bacteroidota bacterium]
MKIVSLHLALLSAFVLNGQQDILDKASRLESDGDFAKSYEYYKKAAHLFYENSEYKEYIRIQLKMVNCQIQLGNPFLARSLSENMVTFLQESLPNEKESYAKAKTLVGLSYLNLARNDEALAHLLEAELIFKMESAEKAQCLDAIGQVYTNNQNYQLASQYLEQGLKLRTKLFGIQSLEVGNSYNNLGRVYASYKPLQAIIYFNRAKKIYEASLGSDDRRTLRAQINIAFSNREQGNYLEALNLLNGVKLMYEQRFGKENLNVAYIQSLMGRILKDQEKYENALLNQKEALQVYLSLYGEKHQEVANTYYLIGEIYRAKKEFKISCSFYQKAIYANLPGQHPTDDYDLPEFTNYLNPDVLLSSLVAKALALEDLHYQKTLNVRDLVGAVDTYVKCDELITIIRRKRLTEQDKIRLGNIAKDVYENGIQISLNLSEGSFNKKNYLARAFEFCERSKSSVLLEAITESRAKEFSGIPQQLLILEDSLRDEISYLEQELATTQTLNKQAWKDLLFTYQNNYRTFIADLEMNYPDYYQLKYSQQIASLGEVQKKLSENTAMLSYFIGKQEVYVFIITSKDIKAERIQKNDRFDRLPKALRNAIKYKIKDAFFKIAKSLHVQLIPKLKSYVNQLIILPDGALGTIPFEVLIDRRSEGTEYTDHRYLIRDYTISYDYSATLFTQRDQNDAIENPEILLVAPIHFHENELGISSLPGSEKEIEEIALLFQGNNCVPKVQMGKNASEFNVKKETLSNYQFVHFATHGIVNESQPSLSRIFLSPDENQDGSLFAGEIYNLDINADLVTLSACETGLGKVAKGEGIVGLSRALQYAGANNIIVSFWQVADESTAQMMIEFYKYHLYNDHHGYNTALRQAKLSLLYSNQYSRPYYWAPFILVGM